MTLVLEIACLADGDFKGRVGVNIGTTGSFDSAQDGSKDGERSRTIARVEFHLLSIIDDSLAFKL